jgi:hypothetical protein
MTTKNNWMGNDGFKWFIGVVQSIKDPMNCGRVQVRCMGWHTPDMEELPVDMLPWAQVMMPITSASNSGIGRSPTGLLQGSFVVGFFLDGEEAQQPVVMGSIHGIPSEDNDPGYSDPDGVYPSQPGIPDTPNLAYDRYVNDKITQDKEAGIVYSIPKASKFTIGSVSPNKGDEDYELKKWDEPAPRNDKTPVYPRNHVTQTESGHAIEIDDTPDAERIHIYHKSGTFCEIQDQGDRVTKIIGNDFEICVQDKNVLISGECNITVSGDARLYVEGDMIQEVGGDYHLMVHGNMLSKINGNDCKEVLGSRSHQVNGDETRRISGKRDLIIGGTLSEDIVGTKKSNSGAMTQIVNGNLNVVTVGSATMASTDSTDIGSGAGLNLGAASGVTMSGGGNAKMVVSGGDAAMTGTLKMNGGSRNVSGVGDSVSGGVITSGSSSILI